MTEQKTNIQMQAKHWQGYFVDITSKGAVLKQIVQRLNCAIGWILLGG